MKIEIKLNQEQFDMIAAALSTIAAELPPIAAQITRMADAWNASPIDTAEPDEQTDNGLTLANSRSDSYIYTRVLGYNKSPFRGFKKGLLDIAIAKTGARSGYINKHTVVLIDDVEKVVEWMQQHKEG